MLGFGMEIQTVMIKGAKKQRVGDKKSTLSKKIPGFLLKNAKKRNFLFDEEFR
jgi:hypothetical protein